MNEVTRSNAMAEPKRGREWVPSENGDGSGRGPAKKKNIWARWLAALGLNSLLLSIIGHVVFGVVATYLVVEHFQKKHINFHATEPPGPHTEVEHKVQLATKNKIESAPPDLKRITTTEVSPISLPDVPVPPPTDQTQPTQISGVGLEGLLGQGAGGGSGGGSGGGGGATLFGATDGTGLTGYFYDLKQTPDKKSSGVDQAQYYRAVADFIGKGWKQKDLDRFYRSKAPLIADKIAISTRPSGAAPEAFHLENEVKPGLWLVYYHGTVVAPKDGNYRLLGFADNLIVVRVAGQIVLDAGWVYLTGDAGLHQPSEFVFPSYVQFAQEQGRDAHLRQGKSFHLNANQPVEMDVLIGDDGGKCSFFLLINKLENTYTGKPVEYPFFQLGARDAPTFSPSEEHPAYSTKSEPWQVSDDQLSPP